MPDPNNPLFPETSAEYEKLAEKYYQEVVTAPEVKRLEFFAAIQRQLEYAIRLRFYKAGYKLVRVSPAPGMYYKVVSQKDAFGFNVLNRHLMLDAMMLDACYIPSPVQLIPPGLPLPPPGAKIAVADIKMLLPGYRKDKIKAVADTAFEKFIPMKKLI